VAEKHAPQTQDVVWKDVLYDKCTMTRVYVADAKSEERSALRLLLPDLNMEVVGEAADRTATLANAPATRLDMLLAEWNLLPINLGLQALAQLRMACPNAIVVVLLSYLDARHQAALSTGADAFISKDETPERVAEHLRIEVAKIPFNRKDFI
jgi:DNA-binding NarL/FixJ family response regulator